MELLIIVGVTFDTGTGQQVAQLHDNYVIMMIFDKLNVACR
jgi:hypothetical protein